MKKVLLLSLLICSSVFAEVSRVEAIRQCQMARVQHPPRPASANGSASPNLQMIYATANPEKFYELSYPGQIRAFRFALNRKKCTTHGLGVDRQGQYQFIQIDVAGESTESDVRFVEARPVPTSSSDACAGALLNQETVGWERAFEVVQGRARHTYENIMNARSNQAQTWMRARDLLQGCSLFLTPDERTNLHQLARQAANFPCRDGKYIGQGGECVVPEASTNAPPGQNAVPAAGPASGRN